jgi:DNA-binding transcriptional regulator YiaG
MKKSINKTDISTLLDQWYDAKNSIAELEEKIEKYKKLASKVMNNNNTNIITDGTYTIKRKEIENLRQNPKANSVKFLRTLNKQVKTLQNLNLRK